jgi:hypothetical protein
LTAAAALAETLLRSGARRVAFLGLAKNVGKTTALVAVLAQLHRRGVVAGTTSAGRDGESFDAITGEAKPRFRVFPGQFVASAATTYAAASFPTTLIAALPFSTRFGLVEIRRADGEGEIEMIGPSTASQMAATAGALESAGAGRVLLDGAIGRRAFACARVADALVLSVGMAAGESLEAVLSAARASIELIRLPEAGPDARVRNIEGALTEVWLADNLPEPGDTLVAEDFTAIFLSPVQRRALRERGVQLAVRRTARLLALTANPTAPARPPLAAARVFEALRREFPEVPVFDLEADLWSEAAGRSSRQ